MIEDYLEQKDRKRKQAYAPVSYGSQFFNASQLNLSKYCKEFQALYFALEYFSDFIWGAEKPVIILTHNKILLKSWLVFFQSKSLHPALWNFMGRVTAYNIVLAHIPGRANAAADFLSRMQTDPTQTLELQLQESNPMKEIETGMKAKTPDASMLAKEPDQPEAVEPQSHILSEDKMNIINSNQALQNLIPHLNDVLASASKDTISEGCLTKRAPEINSLQQNDPSDYFETSTTNAKPLNIPEEQKKDPVIRKVMDWIENGCTDDLFYAPFELKKYHKQLIRLHIQKRILMRQFFDDIGKISHSQICVPKHLRKEVICRIHNSPTGRHLGIVRTAKQFRKWFYFPGLSEHLTDYIKNGFSCSTLKRVTKSNCIHHFNQFHPNNFFRVIWCK